jgi:hypothetical protein
MGLLWLVRGKPTNWWLIPVWLMLGILPAAVARETPHALRIENSLPAWQILTAYGLSRLWFRWRWPVLVIALAGVIYFQHGYWRHYAKEFSGEWQYGYREAIDFIKENQQKYQRLWFTDKLGRPYIYFLFYLQYDPQRFVREAKVEREVWGFVKVRSFDRYHFFNERKEIEPKGRTLVVEEFEKIPPEIKAKKVFYLLNGKPVLAAYEI